MQTFEKQNSYCHFGMNFMNIDNVDYNNYNPTGYNNSLTQQVETNMADGNVPEGTPDPIDIQVGSRVRLFRTRLGMSQERLGSRIGVTFQQIQKYERGVNRISASMLVHIAKAFEIPVSVLFGEGEPENVQEYYSSLLVPGTAELVELYASLSPIGRKVLIGTARTFQGHLRGNSEE